jgi:hypothetical protein
MRIVILGYIVRGPIGGLAWHHLQYVKGLALLGHDVRFVEDSDDYPSCYDPSRHVVDTDPTYGLAFASEAFDRVGLSQQWAYFDGHRSQWLGPDRARIEDFCKNADLILNVSGTNPLREWTAGAPMRALIDTDPVFTQVRNLTVDSARSRSASHNSFFTFAENVANGTAKLPSDGFDWKATRQPVVLDLWKVERAERGASYTTVMQWQSYDPVGYAGRQYGMKSESFPDFIDLPTRTASSLEIALGGADSPRDMLRRNGWRLTNPLVVALRPQDFMHYVAASRGEFSVAKHGYVASNSGWFSERSAAYLASGKPVITQETGFSSVIPSGEGLLSFTTIEEAAAALETVESDYDRHARKSREIAERYFDSGAVLSRLLTGITDS